MSEKPLPSTPEQEDDLDYSWHSLKASATDVGQKSKLFLKNLPGELADAADDYICTKAEAIKESLASRANRTRDRIKRRLIFRAMHSIDFAKKIVFFRVLKLKLDRLRRRFEKLNDENELVQLRCDIGKRMVQLYGAPNDSPETDSSALGQRLGKKDV